MALSVQRPSRPLSLCNPLLPRSLSIRYHRRRHLPQEHRLLKDAIRDRRAHEDSAVEEETVDDGSDDYCAVCNLGGMLVSVRVVF